MLEVDQGDLRRCEIAHDGIARYASSQGKEAASVRLANLQRRISALSRVGHLYIFFSCHSFWIFF